MSKGAAGFEAELSALEDGAEEGLRVASPELGGLATLCKNDAGQTIGRESLR